MHTDSELYLGYATLYFSVSEDQVFVRVLWRRRDRHLFIYLLIYLLAFWGRNNSIWRFPGQRSNWSYSCQPTSQPLQCRIQATSVTYTTAHSNARSLTHLVRPGIKPATSRFLVGFFSAAPQWELQAFIFESQVSHLREFVSFLGCFLMESPWSYLGPLTKIISSGAWESESLPAIQMIRMQVAWR